MTWRVLGPLAGAIAIVGVVVALLAPSNGRVIDPVAKAADTTAAAGTVAFQISGSISADGKNIPLSGDGAIDMRNTRMRMTMNFPVPGAGNFDIEELLDGTTIYMRMPAAVTQRLPGGKAWMKLDLKELGKASGIDFDKAMQANQQNPGDMLEALKGVSDSKVVGHESIRGANTTHYHADVDLKKAVEQVATDKEGAERFRQMADSIGVSSVPVDVWIDGTGRVARQTTKFSSTQFSMDFTIDYTRFGVPVDVTPPPDDQVMDAGAFLGAANG
jgi:type II secretory pathway pseudopilin PulG